MISCTVPVPLTLPGIFQDVCLNIRADANNKLRVLRGEPTTSGVYAAA